MTPNEKITRLKNLKNEVKDIHPLLARLLPVLPNITAVENTHGPDEMGADFVVKKTDTTLNTTTFIGIIAKRGKIDQKNYHDVARQIKETQLDRTFEGGKERIFITELWVISNDNITNPAQRVIHQEHSSSNVRFLPVTKLAELIDKHLPLYWKNTSADLSAYLKGVQAKIVDTETRLSLLGELVSPVYVEPDIRECDSSDYSLKTKNKKGKPKIIDIYEVINHKRLIFLEGEPGVGKSKFLRTLAARIIDKSCDSSPVIPVVFNFKEYVDDHKKDIDSLLKARMDANYETLMKIKDRKILLLADGLDEYPNCEEHQDILKGFFESVEERAEFFCIASSRHIDRYQMENDLLKNIYCVELMALTAVKLISFLKAITAHLSLSQRILEDVKRSPLFRELHESPIAAILLAKLLSEDIRDLPSSLPELYSQYIEVCVGRWEINKALQSQKEYKALNAILQTIAVYMMENGIERLNADEALTFYQDYLGNRPNFNISPEEFFKRTTQRCPIICLIESNSIFVFKHRSFAEFYFARSMATGKADAQINTRAFTPYWAHSIYFYIGLLEEPDQELEAFIKLKPSSEMQGFSKFSNMADLLMAGYSANHQITIDGIKEAAITAARFYLYGVQNPQTSALNALSQIQLLWITQYTFKHAFSYEFFKKSLDDVALAVIQDVDDDELLAIALFLLDVTRIHGEKEADFRFIGEYAKELPIAVKLGIGHESIDRKKGKFVKKLDKNLRERISRDKKLKADIIKAYQNSIRTHVLLS